MQRGGDAEPVQAGGGSEQHGRRSPDSRARAGWRTSRQPAPTVETGVRHGNQMGLDRRDKRRDFHVFRAEAGRRIPQRRNSGRHAALQDGIAVGRLAQHVAPAEPAFFTAPVAHVPSLSESIDCRRRHDARPAVRPAARPERDDPFHRAVRIGVVGPDRPRQHRRHSRDTKQQGLNGQTRLRRKRRSC